MNQTILRLILTCVLASGMAAKSFAGDSWKSLFNGKDLTGWRGEGKEKWTVEHGAIVGGLILGVSESLAGGYISVAFKNTLAFLIIILVLIVRPEGLLGKEFIERV